MGRKKVRHFASVEHYENLLEDYFNTNRDTVLRRLIRAIGEDPDTYGVSALLEDEYNSRWGLDCGWILLYPKNKEMAHEWELDNGKYGAYVWTDKAVPLNVQSTTLKRIMVEEAVADLGLNETFWVSTRLD